MPSLTTALLAPRMQKNLGCVNDAFHVYYLLFDSHEKLQTGLVKPAN